MYQGEIIVLCDELSMLISEPTTVGSLACKRSLTAVRFIALHKRAQISKLHSSAPTNPNEVIPLLKYAPWAAL